MYLLKEKGLMGKISLLGKKKKKKELIIKKIKFIICSGLHWHYYYYLFYYFLKGPIAILINTLHLMFNATYMIGQRKRKRKKKRNGRSSLLGKNYVYFCFKNMCIINFSTPDYNEPPKNHSWTYRNILLFFLIY